MLDGCLNILKDNWYTCVPYITIWPDHLINDSTSFSTSVAHIFGCGQHNNS